MADKADTLAALTTEFDNMIRVWRTGSPSQFDAMFTTFFGAEPFQGYRRGGRLTWHELVFAKWFHHLKPQVTIGTGRGGRSRWGATSYTVDFFDDVHGTVWELDGPSHRGVARQLRDARKDTFLKGLGLEVVRVPNAMIEQWVKETLIHYAEWRLGLRPELDPMHRRRYASIWPAVAAWLKDRDAISEFAYRPVAPQ